MPNINKQKGHPFAFAPLAEFSLNFTKGKESKGIHKKKKNPAVIIIINNNNPMVFSSFPDYLDPSNWNDPQQQQQQDRGHQADGSSGLNAHPHQLQPPSLPPPTPPPPPPTQQLQPPHGPVGGGTTIRPGSMAERARLANIPMPDAALKCPRCGSTNTKFCYFNNYNLLQPRHFCKTCRRYWTSGGALRSVPVGGGFRRNKRTKSSGSNKSRQQSTTSASGSSTSNNSGSNNMLASSAGLETGTTAELLGLMSQIPPLGLISPLHHHHNHHLSDFTSSKIGLNYSGISVQPLERITGDLNFQFGSGGDDSGRNSLLSAVSTGGIEQWRVQQFPYIGNQDPQAGLYPIYESLGEPSIVMTKQMTTELTSHPASLKMEVGRDNNNNNQAELNLSRQMVGIQGNNQFWSTRGNTWTDHSGFSSSSTGHP